MRFRWIKCENCGTEWSQGDGMHSCKKEYEAKSIFDGRMVLRAHPEGYQCMNCGDVLKIEESHNCLGIKNQGIGDITSNEKGSGARYNEGKPDYSLIPMHLLEDTARVFMYGSKKYAAWNWTKGMKWSVPYACALRHLFAWFRGEECDKESGLPHLAHCLANILMLTLYSKTYKEGDDRPPQEFMNGN